MLNDYMMQFIDERYPNDCYFQQHNTDPHRANITKEYFTEQVLTVMDRSSMYPNLNPTENVGCILVRDFYTAFRQFCSLEI